MSKTTEPCETINAMRDLYEAGETDPETLLCALDEVLRVNDALTAKVEQYKRDVEMMRDALKPFAECADQIDQTEDGEEWAKFRLLVKDYRAAYAALNQQYAEVKP